MKRFEGTDLEGYGWSEDGGLHWPGKDVRTAAVQCHCSAAAVWSCTCDPYFLYKLCLHCICTFCLLIASCYGPFVSLA